LRQQRFTRTPDQGCKPALRCKVGLCGHELKAESARKRAACLCRALRFSKLQNKVVHAAASHLQLALCVGELCGER
jgi:hypothetical protein